MVPLKMVGSEMLVVTRVVVWTWLHRSEGASEEGRREGGEEAWGHDEEHGEEELEEGVVDQENRCPLAQSLIAEPC